MHEFITILTIVANFILGLVVYRKNQNSRTNQLFGTLTTILIAWSIANYLSLNTNSPQEILFWIRVVMAITASMFSTIFLLSKSFPKKTISLSKKTITLIVIETIIIQLLALSKFVFSDIDTTLNSATPIPGFGMPLYAAHTLLYLTASIHSLINKKNDSKGLEKIQLNYMLFGIASTFVLATLTTFLFVTLLKITNFVILGPSYSLMLASFTAYAIIKHKFLDISALIGRAISFTFLTIIVSGLYGFTLFTISSSIPEKFHTIGNIIAALVLASTFSKLRSLIQRVTENILHISTYSSEKVLGELGDIANATLSLKKITQKTLHTLLKSLHITKGAFLLIEGNPKQIVVEQFRWNTPPNISLNKVNYLIKKTRGNTIFFDNLDEGKTKKILREENISLVLPLITPNGSHGILILGGKQSGNSYSNQDMEMLEVFQSQISMAIQNSLDYEKIRHFNKTLRDQVKIATEKLRKANKNLRHLDKVKDEFVYIATHELKNPVTAMRGYLSMINEGNFGRVSKELQDPLDQLNQSNQQLVNLVNDLLQIARAEAKTLRVNISQVNICAIATQTIANLKPLADQKKLSIKYAHAKDEIIIDADPDRLKEVFNNLITNAIKYSDKGAITINHATEGDLIITHIKDHGVGITKKDQKKIFTRFFRADEEVLKGVPGSGLGLFIVRQLVEKMSGKIWFTTKYGEGTTFSFSLPKT